MAGQNRTRKGAARPGEAGRLSEWRGRIAAHRRVMLDRHRRGAGGFEICTLNTVFFDGLIGELYDRAAQVHDGAPDIALCATGSYGRGELAPHSDIDLVFLLPRAKSETAARFMHEVIRLAWDVGLEASHVARTLAESLALARENPAVKTTFIDLRLLRGEGRLFEKLTLGFDQLVIDGAVDRVVPRRQETVNLEPGYPLSSITVLEPNLKESPGALRDFHLALWTARLHHFKNGLAEIARSGIITVRQEIEVRIAVDFMLRLRNEIHFLQERKADTLVLEIQGEAAENLGYVAAGREQAIEALMRDYYHNASTIFRFSKDLVDRCLEDAGHRLRGRPKKAEGGLVTDGERLDFAGKRAIADDPVLLLRVFRVAAERGLSLSTDARKLLRSSRYLMDDDLRENPEAAAEFLKTLQAPRCAPALREMHDCHVLGDYLPEFGGLHHLVNYDVFHRFTADEHTLLSLHFLEELEDAADPERQTLADVYRSLPDRHVVKLALLLHDIGKAGGPGHVERGLRLIPLVAHRLRLDEETTDAVLHLVRRHMLMSELAIKRDIHDRELLLDFTRRARDERSLKRLFVLTYADMKAVGPGVWNRWKAALLEELYFKARRQMSRAPEESEVDYYRKIREENMHRLEGRVDPATVEGYFARMPKRFLTWLDPDRILRHLAILERLGDGPCEAAVHRDERVGFLEVLVCSRDTQGLFSRIAGVVTSQGLNILGAQVFTLDDGIILDTLQVETIEGRPAPEPEELARAVSWNLTQILEGKLEVHQLVGSRPRFFRKRRDRIQVPVSVVLDNELSLNHTVVEVIARDRPGLLFEITDAIRNHGLNIHLAKINTEATRVIDVFYLEHLGGGKVDDPELLEGLAAEIRRIVTPREGGR